MARPVAPCSAWPRRGSLVARIGCARLTHSPIDSRRYILFHFRIGNRQERDSVPQICKVLIVEDDQAVQQVFNLVLAAAGYELRLARDARSMRDALNAGDVDVVVIDVILPGGANGFALAQEAVERGCGVILVTGHHDRYGEVEKSGHRYLFKPFRMSALIDMVEQVARENDLHCRVGRRTRGD